MTVNVRKLHTTGVADTQEYTSLQGVGVAERFY